MVQFNICNTLKLLITRFGVQVPAEEPEFTSPLKLNRLRGLFCYWSKMVKSGQKVAHFLRQFSSLLAARAG